MDLVRVSTAGSVDDGKSTLIGRLLVDARKVHGDQVAAARATARRMGDGMELSLLLDGLKAEREQGITIDVAYRYFATSKRSFIIADTPGHEQYTRNMVTGASTADIAVVLMDARKGLLMQSKRHAFIANLLGIKHLVVAVNKMDLVDYAQARFDTLCSEFLEFTSRLDIPDLRFVPVSALHGDNVVARGESMSWYDGLPLLQLLESIHVASDRNMVDLRFPVQTVIRPNQDFRGYAGQLASGIMRVGDDVVALPSLKRSRIRSIRTYDGDLERAFPPMSVTIELEDELDISRGDVLVHPHNQPRSQRALEAMMVWLSESPMDPKSRYMMRLGTQLLPVRMADLLYRVDVNTLHREDASLLELNEIGRLVVASGRQMHFDPYEKNRNTGCFVWIDPTTHNTVAAGMVIDRAPQDQLPGAVETWHELHRTQIDACSSVTEPMRQERTGFRAATIWITGLVGSGKRPMAYALEEVLFDRGANVTVLDGGRLRETLSADLDFTSDDTAEHLRRAAEAARLMNDAGMIVICAFVSPLRSQRAMARQIVGDGRFIEVHANRRLDACELGDTTGLYRDARAGKIHNLAGVNAPYEAPESAPTFESLDDLNALEKRLVARLGVESVQ